MRRVLVAVIVGLAISPALAQDPGLQDSVIFISSIDHFDSSGEYQYCNIEEWAVTDDSVAFYNIPLRWLAPRGGVTCASISIWWPWPPYNYKECYRDTILLEQSFVRQLYSASPDSDAPYYCPVVYTYAERLHIKTLHFVILPNAPSQLVVLDTCVDPLNGPVLFGLPDGMTEITPGVQRAFLSIGSVGVDDENPIPASFSLAQNYPNPFNAQTTISYTLPQKGPVTLSVYNLLGQRVAMLFEGMQEAGEHKVVWEAEDAPSGVYFYRLASNEYAETRRMVMIR